MVSNVCGLRFSQKLGSGTIREIYGVLSLPTLLDVFFAAAVLLELI